MVLGVVWCWVKSHIRYLIVLWVRVGFWMGVMIMMWAVGGIVGE